MVGMRLQQRGGGLNPRGYEIYWSKQRDKVTGSSKIFRDSVETRKIYIRGWSILGDYGMGGYNHPHLILKSRVADLMSSVGISRRLYWWRRTRRGGPKFSRNSAYWKRPDPTRPRGR